MKSITYKWEWETIADYNSIRKLIIRDRVPLRKQGVSDYWIEIFDWYKERKYLCCIESTWFIDGYQYFPTLRAASEWVKQRMSRKKYKKGGRRFLSQLKQGVSTPKFL